MLKKLLKRFIGDKSGSSLLEVMISIVILAMVVVPLGSSFVMAVRLNTESRALMQQQLAVSNAVELLMARGIALDEKGDPIVDTSGLEHVIVSVAEDDATLSAGKPVCYPVTVEYSEGSKPYSLTTTIRVVPNAADTDPEHSEGGGET